MSRVTTPVDGRVPVHLFLVGKLKDRLQPEDLEAEREAGREAEPNAPVHSPADSEGSAWPSPNWEILAIQQLNLLVRPGPSRDRYRALIHDPISSKLEAEYWINRQHIARFGKRLDDAEFEVLWARLHVDDLLPMWNIQAQFWKEVFRQSWLFRPQRDYEGAYEFYREIIERADNPPSANYTISSHATDIIKSRSENSRFCVEKVLSQLVFPPQIDLKVVSFCRKWYEDCDKAQAPCEPPISQLTSRVEGKRKKRTDRLLRIIQSRLQPRRSPRLAKLVS